LKKPLDPGIGSTLYNPWSDWHEFRKEFLSKSFYRSGELAELAGVSSDTLRHYR
jgi:hypothetical protein